MTGVRAWIVAALATLLTLGVGLSLGLAGADFAVRGEPPFGAVRSGAWTAWPGAGGLDADPYARAVAARDGRIPLASGAGVRFVARTDSDGQPLAGRCNYTVAGPTPPAQAWTLTLLDPAGLPPPKHGARTGFTSAEPVRALDGSFAIVLAAEVQPGNWLPVPGPERFILMLDLYDTPLGTALLMGAGAPALPRIARGVCG